MHAHPFNFDGNEIHDYKENVTKIEADCYKTRLYVNYVGRGWYLFLYST